MNTINHSRLRGLERRVVERLRRCVPAWMGTKMLTYLGLAATVLTAAGYERAASDRRFLWAASAGIVLQWAFDCLDGEIGRSRAEGYVRWGFYMDHLFDYFFLAAVMYGLWRVLPQCGGQLLLLSFLAAAFMAQAFLYHSAAAPRGAGLQVSFYGFSPIEFRLAVLGLNALVFLRPAAAAEWALRGLPVLNLVLAAGLVAVIGRSQRRLHRLDESARGERVSSASR